MPVSLARGAAFDILLRVERESSYAAELLHSKTYAYLSMEDHALTMELVMGVLRWRSRLDEEIAQGASRPLSKLDLEVLIALRLAVYQLRWLDRVPARAALYESVELVKRARKKSAAPFVNAVLRKLSGKSPDSRSEPTTAQALAREFAHPEWMVQRWVEQYGFEAASAICKYDQSIPATAIRLRDKNVARELVKGGISVRPGKLLASARLIASGDITDAHALHSGKIVIQDEGAQLVAALVGTNLQATRILDCCAAPGGKTLGVADRNPEAAITAVDVHTHRARLLQRLIRSTSPDAKITVLTADAQHLPISQPFHRVLADVPCSGTGTLARNPEIKWRLKLDDLRDLHSRQLAILRAAMEQVSPAGRVIYSTCSLEREENEDVVEKALANNGAFHVIDCEEELDRLKTAGDLVWPGPSSLTRGPYLRTVPGIHPCDGFFAAILERN